MEALNREDPGGDREAVVATAATAFAKAVVFLVVPFPTAP